MERPGADGLLAAGVADVGLGVVSGEGADRGDHAAVVLEVVVGVGDVVLRGVHVLRRDLDPPVGGAHVLGGLDSLYAAPVGVPAPGGVDLREIGVVSPGTGLDELQQTGAVGPGLGTEDPAGVLVESAVGTGVGPDVVALVRLVEVLDHLHRVVEQCQDVRERVAEEPGDTDGGVDARAAQFLQTDDLEVRDPAGGLVPDRPDTEEGEHLGDVVAGGAHRGGAPDRQPDGRRVGAVVVLAVAIDQRVGEQLTGLPGEAAGQ